MVDEGIEQCLDLIRETAAINVVMPYSHAFHTATLGKPLRDLATDHGKAPRDFRGRVPAVWVRHHEEYFRDTRLRVVPPDPSLEFADRDLFAELIEPSRQRDMRVYARVLEASGSSIRNFDDIRTIDVYGNPGRYGCWAHPDYRNFWAAVFSDMFRSYELDGLQWGAERMGPIMNVILPWNDNPPTCFCEHCIARGEAADIDAGRAREGYTRLFEYVRGLIDGEPGPPEGHGGCRLARRSPALELGPRLSRRDELRGDGRLVRLHQADPLPRRARRTHPFVVPRALPEHGVA
jgi:hypothetical protein